MAKRRVVITGLGVLSCLGSDPDLFYKNLLAGKSGIGPITHFPCEEFSTRFAGYIHDFDPGEYIDRKQARRVDRCIAFALVAAKKALEHAKIPLSKENGIDPTRAGVIIGSGIGGMNTFYDNCAALLEKGPKRVSPFLIPYILTDMSSGLLAQDMGFMGPNYSVSSACATSNHAIIAALRHIQYGEADLMVCGGVEAPISPIGLGGFCAVKALSERNDDPQGASRPWDKGRDGFVMGEGAGILVLESYEHAVQRGATILAEVLGGAATCDAHHMTEPRPDGKGVALCMHNALNNAGVREDQIGYINAHATSTPLGDMAEIGAILQVIKKPEKVAISATKSMVGHSLGAAGGIEAVATVQALTTGLIHPTINLSDPEELPFIVPTEALKLSVDYAISNSFGFGGHNACVVFGRVQ